MTLKWKIYVTSPYVRLLTDDFCGYVLTVYNKELLKMTGINRVIKLRLNAHQEIVGGKNYIPAQVMK